jgi:hypothetical protein
MSPRPPSPRRLLPLALVPLALAVAGCTDDQDPEGAMELWDRVHAEGYQSWQRAPGYETRRPTDAPHADEVEIFVNPVVVEALAGPAITSWPVGSLIAKDGYADGEIDLVALMEKRSDGWFWAEYDADGESSYSGKPDICIDCHSSGADLVRAFGFPQ